MYRTFQTTLKTNQNYRTVHPRKLWNRSNYPQFSFKGFQKANANLKKHPYHTFSRVKNNVELKKVGFR